MYDPACGVLPEKPGPLFVAPAEANQNELYVYLIAIMRRSESGTESEAFAVIVRRASIHPIRPNGYSSRDESPL